MRTYNMADMLAYSRGVREETDIATIRNMIAGCVDVAKTDETMDRAGTDYIARLRKGAEVLIDAKTRTPGCSRYWHNGPELALEIWSVRPRNGHSGKTGWTLCESKNVDYIFFKFHPDDSDIVFLYPFQLLRMTFRENLNLWRAMNYRTDIQSSGGWQSECIFIPELVVWDAMRETAKGRQVRESSIEYLANNN